MYPYCIARPETMIKTFFHTATPATPALDHERHH
jgi:hypothetical protein